MGARIRLLERIASLTWRRPKLVLAVVAGLVVVAAGVRREVHRISDALARAKHVGRVVNPLENRREARTLIAKDGRSLVLLGHLSTQEIESDGGEAAEDAARRVRSTTLDVDMAGFATSFNEVNDQTR